MTLCNERNDTSVIRQVTILVECRMSGIIRGKKRHQQQKEPRRDRDNTPTRPSQRKTVERLLHSTGMNQNLLPMARGFPRVTTSQTLCHPPTAELLSVESLNGIVSFQPEMRNAHDRNRHLA